MSKTFSLHLGDTMNGENHHSLLSKRKKDVLCPGCGGDAETGSIQLSCEQHYMCGSCASRDPTTDQYGNIKCSRCPSNPSKDLQPRETQNSADLRFSADSSILNSPRIVEKSKTIQICSRNDNSSEEQRSTPQSMPNFGLSLCQGCNKNTNMYCKDCNHYICETCKTVHLKFLSHTIECKTPILPSLVLPNCNNHLQPIALQCKNCNCSICLKCVEENHQNHETTQISVHLEKIAKEIIDKTVYPFLNRVDSHRKKVQQKQENVAKGQKELEIALGKLKQSEADMENSTNEAKKLLLLSVCRQPEQLLQERSKELISEIRTSIEKNISLDFRFCGKNYSIRISTFPPCTVAMIKQEIFASLRLEIPKDNEWEDLWFLDRKKTTPSSGYGIHNKKILQFSPTGKVGWSKLENGNWTDEGCRQPNKKHNYIFREKEKKLASSDSGSSASESQESPL